MESARAHSYFSISTGVQTVRLPAVTIVHPVSKVSYTILYTVCSVKKCLAVGWGCVLASPFFWLCVIGTRILLRFARKKKSYEVYI